MREKPVKIGYYVSRKISRKPYTNMFDFFAAVSFRSRADRSLEYSYNAMGLVTNAIAKAKERAARAAAKSKKPADPPMS